MKKKLIVFTALISLAFSAFGQDGRSVQSSIETIENFKAKLIEEDRINSKTKKEYYDYCSQLEQEVWTCSYEYGEVQLQIQNYNLEEYYWPMKISMFFEGTQVLNQTIQLMYSTLMSKKYIPPKQMTEHQLEDYEYYVQEYDNIFATGKYPLNVQVDFKVISWEKPSEYLFEIQEIRIYNNKERPILTIEKANIKSTTFSLRPALEIRNQKDISKDKERIKKYNSNVVPIEIFKKKKEYTGRRSFTFFVNREFSEIDFDKMGYEDNITNIGGTLTWNITKWYFMGLDVGYDISELNTTGDYEFGFINGFNFNFSQFFRPYVFVDSAIKTNDNIIFRAGAGFDIILKHFMLTASYDYNWHDSYDTFFLKDNDISSNHCLKFGLGLSW